ncbi:DUF1289 domain-containing protein [Pseudomonas pohangensis]|uniref:DUF1289 domain-containing protein n=1 Tax=Pseudomonas pohangensis TaxID=364197 RepID=UPI000B7F9508|nr:DUF1289 domain-containing protein [Pseudomonas pohangensis]
MSSSWTETQASPCVRNCCLDDEDICLGCGRSLGEILEWSAAGDARRRAIRAIAAARRQPVAARGRSAE